MSKTALKITQHDRGRAMALDDFDAADAEEGQLFELGRGIVVVTEIPRPSHEMIVDAIRMQLTAHRLAHPGQIHMLASGAGCKILLASLNSERHPDLAVYKSPPPRDDAQVWSLWIPDLAVEVVSPGSEHRDYVEKREEYLQFGVREYWIVDAAKQEMLALQRSRGQWAEQLVKPGTPYRPIVLPGFEFNLAAIFAAQ